jgi:ketosteroid isomerase-like protein
LQEAFVEALKAGDVGKIVAQFCEDAVFMPPNETSLYGREEIEEWYGEYFQHFKITSLNITERELVVLDGWAIERRCHMVAIVPVQGGETIRDDGRQLIVWRREEDSAWRCAQFIFNSIRPIGSGTSRFLARISARRNLE